MQSPPLIAFDQHAATTVAAVLLPDQATPELHALLSDSATILRFVERWRRAGPMRYCYEAGPCGFELQRALASQGIPCDVTALVPRRPGDRIKTDRRDAGQLAVLYHAGALTPIHIPSEQEEAARDLLRARHRLSKFLLRHGREFTQTKTAWSRAHLAWLRAQQWPFAALQQTQDTYLRAARSRVGSISSSSRNSREGLQPLDRFGRPRVARPAAPPRTLPAAWRAWQSNISSSRANWSASSGPS